MPALPVLSVEVWQTILRFSISTAGFFDPDTFEGDLRLHGFGDADGSTGDETTYWRSERTRNTLRHVCKAWDAYLRHFEHRYVRMADVMHQKIDEKFIKKATRISFYRYPCTCRGPCCSMPGFECGELSSGMDPMDGDDPFWQFCCVTLLGLQDLPAEIIDMDGVLRGFLWYTGALRSLKEVKVVTSCGSLGDGVALPLFSQTPSLKHIHGMAYDHPQHSQFISRTLVTFSLSVQRESYKTLILDLPALRHLRICLGSEVKTLIFFETILFPFFEKAGYQLRSLYIDTWDREYQIPAESWERCPHLEIFHPDLTIKDSAPMLHPVHTLSIIPDFMPQTLKLQWPNLRRLILDGEWSRMFHEELSELFSLWRIELQDRGVTFEDRDGIALASAMRTRGLI